MTDIFVFGTLCHDRVRRIVAGQALVTRQASLPDAAVMAARATGRRRKAW